MNIVAGKEYIFLCIPVKQDLKLFLHNILCLLVRKKEDPEKERKEDFSQVQGYNL